MIIINNNKSIHFYSTISVAVQWCFTTTATATTKINL